MRFARSSHPQRSDRAPAGGAPLLFDIPSELSASRDVQQAIMTRVSDLNYGEQSSFAIRLALEEALMNAIKHGNKLDPAKRVHIEARITPGKTEIIVEDQGQGFDRSAVPDPCCEANLLKCSGRGILLIESYMDNVRYTRGGRRVRMVKKNT